MLRTALVHEEQFKAADRDLAWTSMSRTEPDAKVPSEIEKLSLSSGQHPRIQAREWICLAEVAPVAEPADHPVNAAFLYAWTYLANKTRGLFQSVGGLLVRKEEFKTADHDMAWTSMTRIEQTGTPTEIDKLSLSSNEYSRRDIDEALANRDRIM